MFVPGVCVPVKLPERSDFDKRDPGPSVRDFYFREDFPMKHFCPCRNTACRCHPSNHEEGCSLCIEKELGKREIPSCFFDLVIAPGETVEDCSIEAFARLVLERDTAGSVP